MFYSCSDWPNHSYADWLHILRAIYLNIFYRYFTKSMGFRFWLMETQHRIADCRARAHRSSAHALPSPSCAPSLHATLASSATRHHARTSPRASLHVPTLAATSACPCPRQPPRAHNRGGSAGPRPRRPPCAKHLGDFRVSTPAASSVCKEPHGRSLANNRLGRQTMKRPPSLKCQRQLLRVKHRTCCRVQTARHLCQKNIQK